MSSKQKLLKGENIKVTLEGEEVQLSSNEVEITRKVRDEYIAYCDGLVTIVLDINLNEELLMEGLAREVVNKINTMRRTLKT